MAESSNFGLRVLPEGPRALLIQSKIPESSLNFSPCSLESPKPLLKLGWSTGT